jgi:peptidylglycine monooxygenase
MAEEQLACVVGARRYHVQRPWGTVPADMGSARASQLGVDRHGCVYLFRRDGVPVVVLDPEGNYLRSFGCGVIADAHGICVTPDDKVILVDRDAHQVIVTDLDGHELFRIGQRHAPRQDAPFNHPTDAAVAADGRIYVTDGYGNSRIHRFAADGTHELSWGAPGKGPGQFSTPHGVWVLSDGRVVTVDRENDRLQVFTADGGFLTEWGDFHRPMDVWADAEDHVWVSDQIPRLSRVAPDGTLVGRCRPVWNGGHGICGDAAGNIFLAEGNPPRITKLAIIPD